LGHVHAFVSHHPSGFRPAIPAAAVAGFNGEDTLTGGLLDEILCNKLHILAASNKEYPNPNLQAPEKPQIPSFEWLTADSFGTFELEYSLVLGSWGLMFKSFRNGWQISRTVLHWRHEEDFIANYDFIRSCLLAAARPGRRAGGTRQ
jgi:hypothetical protein